MRYIIIAALIVCFFSYNKTVHATCEVTVESCLPSDDGDITLRVYSYDSSSYWDTIIYYQESTLSYDEEVDMYCDNSSSCYILTELFFVSGEIGSDSATVSCNDYACVDGTISDDDTSASLNISISSDEYCCNGNTCTTFCD